ncbi:MAG TPA: hypothetical protein VFX16_08475 [Pseudonocardiaceae bacterium]|nr:hypothetical protein [Pseudonocardiaceae bacterium]
MLGTWARMVQLAPDQEHAVVHIARLNGMDAAGMEHTRQARNACAHTIDGRPSPDDLTRTFQTAYALRELTRDIRLTAVRGLPPTRFNQIQEFSRTALRKHRRRVMRSDAS